MNEQQPAPEPEQSSDKSYIVKRKPYAPPGDWWHEKFLELFKTNGNVGRACDQLSVGRETVYAHRREYPEFARRWREIAEGHVDDIEEAAHIRALEGKSDVMLIFLLKSRRPEVYRENNQVQINITQKPAKPLDQMTDVEIDEYEASLLEARNRAATRSTNQS